MRGRGRRRPAGRALEGKSPDVRTQVRTPLSRTVCVLSQWKDSHLRLAGLTGGRSRKMWRRRSKDFAFKAPGRKTEELRQPGPRPPYSGVWVQEGGAQRRGAGAGTRVGPEVRRPWEH